MIAFALARAFRLRVLVPCALGAVVLTPGGLGTAFAADEIEFARGLFEKGYFDLGIEELEALRQSTSDANTRMDALSMLQWAYQHYSAQDMVPPEMRQVFRDRLPEIEEEITQGAGSILEKAMHQRSMAITRWKSVYPEPPADMDAADVEATKASARTLINEAIETLKADRDARTADLQAAFDENPPDPNKIDELSAKHAVSWVYFDDIRYDYAGHFLRGAERDKAYKEILTSIEEWLFEGYTDYLIALRAYYVAGRIHEDMGNVKRANEEFSQILNAKIEADWDPDNVKFVMNLKREVYDRGIQAARSARDWTAVVSSVNNFFAEFPTERDSEQGRLMLFVKYEAVVNQGVKEPAIQVYKDLLPIVESEQEEDERWKPRAWTIIGRIGILFPDVVSKKMVYRGANAYYQRNQFREAADAYQNLLSSLLDKEEFEKYGPEMYQNIADCFFKLGRGMEEAFVHWQASRKFQYFTQFKPGDPVPAHMAGFFTTMDELRSFPAREALFASKKFGSYSLRTDPNPYFKGLKKALDDEIIRYFQSFPEVAASRVYEQAEELYRDKKFVAAAEKFAAIDPSMGEYYVLAQDMPGRCYFFQAVNSERDTVAAGSAVTSSEREMFERIRSTFPSDPNYAFIPDQKKKELLGWLDQAETQYRNTPIMAHFSKARFFYGRYFFWLYANDEREVTEELNKLASGQWLVELPPEKRKELEQIERSYLDILQQRDLDQAAELQPKVALARKAAYESGALGDNAQQYMKLATMLQRRFELLAVARYYQSEVIHKNAGLIKDKMNGLGAETPEYQALAKDYVKEHENILIEINDFWPKFGAFLGDSHKLRPAIIKAEFRSYLYIANYGEKRREERVMQAYRSLKVFEDLYCKKPDSDPKDKEWVDSQRRQLGVTLQNINDPQIKTLIDTKLSPLLIAYGDVKKGTSALQAVMDGLRGEVGEPELADRMAGYCREQNIDTAIAKPVLTPEQNAALAGMVEEVRVRHFKKFVELENASLDFLLPPLLKKLDEGGAEPKSLQIMGRRLFDIERFMEAAKLLEAGYAGDEMATRGVGGKIPKNWSWQDRNNKDDFMLKMMFVDCYTAVCENQRKEELRRQGGALGKKKYGDEWRANWGRLMDYLIWLDYMLDARDHERAKGRVVPYEDLAGNYYAVVKMRKADCHWMLALDERNTNPDSDLKAAEDLYRSLMNKFPQYSPPWWDVALKYATMLKMRNNPELVKFLDNRAAVDGTMGGLREQFDKLR